MVRKGLGDAGVDADRNFTVTQILHPSPPFIRLIIVTRLTVNRCALYMWNMWRPLCPSWRMSEIYPLPVLLCQCLECNQCKVASAVTCAFHGHIALST